jgi:transposase InsO family protein
MRFAFIRVEKANYPVRALCRVLEVSRSGYYAFEAHQPSAREVSDRNLVVAIKEVHDRHRQVYGSPRIHRDLRETAGHRVGRKRIARLMREEGIVGRSRRRFCRTTDSNHDLAIAENILDRQFEVARPNEAWVTDITYIRTYEGWLYLAAILDLFSRRVVGYAMSSLIDGDLVLAALASARSHRRPPRGLLHHSDRGSQYASHAYQEALEEIGITCSMSRRGNCWDNAVAESFFGTLKSETTDQYETRAMAVASITDYIDNFYNPTRRHSSLDYLSPIEYELRYEVARSNS